MLLLGTVGAWVAGLWWGNPALLAVAMLETALIEHECSHGSLPGGPRWNRALGWVAGVLGVCPFSSYRAGHRAHHRFLGDPARDPTVSPQEAPGPRRWLELLYRIRVIPALYWGGVYWPYVRYRPAWRDLALSVVLFALAGPKLALVLGFIGAGILYEHLFTSSQHLGLRVAVRLPRQPPSFHLRMAPGTRQLAASRTVPLPLSALVFHFTLHKEHHAAPGLPWYRLPALHAALRQLRPDLYAWTREDVGQLWRRPGSVAVRLRPRLGDGATL